MVNSNTVKLCLVASFVVASPKALAQAPDAESWRKSIHDFPSTAIVPQTLLVTKGLVAGKPKSHKIPRDVFDDYTAFSIITQPMIDVFHAINQPWIDSEFYNPTNWAEKIMSGLSVDIMVHPANKTWDIYLRYPAGDVIKIDRKKVASPQSNDLSTIAPIIAQALGYSGYILDKKGDYVLVAEFGFIETQAQALAFQNSASLHFIKEKHPGSAMLEKASETKGYGVYKIIISHGGKDIAVGDKVIHDSIKAAPAT